MSAFTVSDYHISAILRNIPYGEGIYLDIDGERCEFRQGSNLDRLGQILWDENYRSVNYRYKEYTPAPRFRNNHRARVLSAVEVLKALDCLEYQSCECPDYYDTVAYRAIETLRRMFIRKIRGYGDASWEVRPYQSEAI